MHAVIFEAKPLAAQFDAYLGIARMLRPELEQVDGFVENRRFRSRRRPGWLLSLSTWRDEAALVRWRSHALHHGAQHRGRQEIFEDYHLRVGVFAEAGRTGMLTVLEMPRAAGQPADLPPEDLARRLDLPGPAGGLVAWDLFAGLLEPDRLLLLLTWQDQAAAQGWQPVLPDGDAERRDLDLLRDYGMFRRQQAPQHHAPVQPRT